MLVLNKNNGEDSNESESSLNNDNVNKDNDDEFGMEGGGWCCFKNSLLIIYLHMWLNEKPNLTYFVRRQIPADVQCDSAKADANQKKRKVSDSMTTKIFFKTQASTNCLTSRRIEQSHSDEQCHQLQEAQKKLAQQLDNLVMP